MAWARGECRSAEVEEMHRDARRASSSAYPRLLSALCDRSSSFKPLLGAPHENLLPLWSNLTKTWLQISGEQIKEALYVKMLGAFKTILWSRALSLRRRWFDSTIYLSVTGCWRKAFKYAKKGGRAHNTSSSLNSGANAPQELRDVKKYKLQEQAWCCR